jgi:hypothetical protein
MKRDCYRRFWVGSIGILASSYRLSGSSTDTPLPSAVIGHEKANWIVVELAALAKGLRF